jgi:endonuclease YncB( thermonuclease family)
MNRVLVSALLLATGAGLLGQLPQLPAPTPPPTGLHPWTIPQRGTVSVYVGRVLDGDTAEVYFLAGPVHLRVAGIQAPELKAKGGPESRDALKSQIEGKVVAADLRGPDKYRWAIFDTSTDGKTWLSDWMIGRGYAVKWNGEGPKP